MYRELLTKVAPRPIRTESEAARIQSKIDGLLDTYGSLSKAEHDLLDLLGALMSDWEADRYDPPSTSPLQRLRALLADNGIKQADLVGPVFPTRSVASEVLSGKRPLTAAFIQRLISELHVPPALFFN